MSLAVATACLGLVGTGAAPASATAYVPIVGAGSTWVQRAVDDWTSDVAQQGLQVSYVGTGSTDGRNQFRAGTADFAVSEVPYGLTDNGVLDPPPSQPFAYVPIAGGGTSFMYHLTSGGQRITNLRLDPVTVAKIFTGGITEWNDPEIAAENPGIALPARTIVPVVRSDAAESTAQLTAWFASQPSLAPIWNAYCAANGRATPCGETSSYPVPSSNSGFVAQSLDPGVAGYVAQPTSEGTITYTEYSYALESGFPVAKLRNAGGAYVLPAAGNVTIALQQAAINAQGLADLSAVYTSSDPRAYPLSGVSYLIAPLSTAAPFTALKGQSLGTFADYALCPGQQNLAALGYAPLAPAVVQASLATVGKVPGASGVPSPTCTDQTTALIAATPQPQPCDLVGSAAVCGATSTNPVPALAISPGGAAHQGDPVTFTATIDPSVTGTFTLSATGSALAPTPVTFADVNGTGTVVLSTLLAGTYSFTVSFTPSAANWTTTSPPIGFTVIHVDRGPGSVTVTTVMPPGELVIAVPGNPNVVLPDPVLNAAADAFQTTGALSPIVVTDNRAGSPGWTATSVVSDFTDTAGHVIAGGNLGWTPSVANASPAQTVTAGASVAPGANGGLGTSKTLATCTGLGTVQLGAALQFDVPTATLPGTYTATLVITVL